MSLLIEQVLNGVQLGLMLFLLAAGLTLIFGIMGVINLAHGSFYMLGAFVAATVAARTGSFWLALPAGIAGAAAAGLLVSSRSSGNSTPATTSTRCSRPSGSSCSSMN